MMKKFANMVLPSQITRRSKLISKMAAAEERFCDLNRRFISARKTRFFGKHGKYFQQLFFEFYNITLLHIFMAESILKDVAPRNKDRYLTKITRRQLFLICSLSMLSFHHNVLVEC